MNMAHFHTAPEKQPDFNRLRFVLVETSRAGNVGAAARAMKTMGFSKLFLVNPRDPEVLTHEEAVAFASGAQDILASARIVTTLDEALEGSRFAVAVSARLREFSPPVIDPRSLGKQLAASSAVESAIIFGNERYGLPNEIVERCNALVNIPANPSYSSLNLSQAVQVLAYECRMALTGGLTSAPDIGFSGDPASVSDIDGMFAHLEKALVSIDFLDPHNPKKLMPRLRRLLSRTQLEAEEVNILRGIARHILLHAGKDKPS